MFKDQNVQKSFNPFFHYALINGGQDGGAYISDSLNMLKKYGICETSKREHFSRTWSRIIKT